MIGASIAKGLAIGFGKSYLAINHLEGHLLSPFFAQAKIRPNVSLIVSGGHTNTLGGGRGANYGLIGPTGGDAPGERVVKDRQLLGVSCNQELRRQLHEACSRERLQLQSAEPWLCTDNAAMIAFAASLRLQHGFESSVTEEIDPSLALR